MGMRSRPPLPHPKPKHGSICGSLGALCALAPCSVSIRRAQQKMQTSEANYRAAKADLLPKFNVQYGIQEVQNQSGFYTYQAGVSIPLFFENKN